MFTTTTSHSRTSAAAVAAVIRVATKAVNTIAAYWNAHMRRREVRELLGWNDHMLKDIGITRGDVASAYASPYPVDPTARLKIMAVERRAAAREQARERLRAADERPSQANSSASDRSSDLTAA
ncbi:DUF1127 domain-containing protein [Methyloraptor flagellatus]|jgi:uncharacterized protein YjiS (DUF1127 family)|uniref:DUF1127 domain-containing protein n=1 Tax=Methyloraptor flagellatus TaxID=3162530 RepID=A0AAU7X813_9HYPH